MNSKKIREIIEKSIASNQDTDTDNKDKSKSSKEIDEKHEKKYKLK